MSDDEFPEGNAESEAAEVATEDVERATKDANQFGIDSSSTTEGTPVLRQSRSTARAAQARKAFAEAVIASKKEAATKPPSEVDELDPEAPDSPALKPAGKPVRDVASDIAAAKAAGAEAVVPPPAAAKTPPAPSLDPEVRQLRELLKAERDAIAAERAELAKERKPAESAAVTTAAAAPDLEAYIDSPPAAYRNWLESMRGEKFATDDEFKSEVSDFITMMSADVLGVPLPELVRAKLDSAQAKKIVRTNKMIQTRKEAAAAEKAKADELAATTKAETERVEQEWTKAATVLSQQFAHAIDVEGKPAPSAAAKAYKWLAAEDDPGGAIVDVIRAHLNKDGTKLSWQEAAKLADEYLAGEATKYYDKRKSLLSSDAKQVVPPAPKVIAPADPVAALKTAVRTPPEGAVPKWSRDKHIEKTKAAFRAAVANQTK